MRLEVGLVDVDWRHRKDERKDNKGGGLEVAEESEPREEPLGQEPIRNFCSHSLNFELEEDHEKEHREQPEER